MADLRITEVSGTPGNLLRPSGIEKEEVSGFGEVLRKSIESVNSRLQEADELAAGLVSGSHANIHETMIAMEKANISFRLLTKVQNKVISAYEEIQRLQL